MEQNQKISLKCLSVVSTTSDVSEITNLIKWNATRKTPFGIKIAHIRQRHYILRSQLYQSQAFMVCRQPVSRSAKLLLFYSTILSYPFTDDNINCLVLHQHNLSFQMGSHFPLIIFRSRGLSANKYLFPPAYFSVFTRWYVHRQDASISQSGIILQYLIDFHLMR